jgi:hypothetical protein
MRIASRVIGAVLALAGVAFFVVSFFAVTDMFDRKSVLVQWNPDRTEWIASAILAALGTGFMLAGWRYLRLDIDKIEDNSERPAWRFAPFFLAHRREVKIVAQAGLVLSLIRLAAAWFGSDWPGNWTALVLPIVSIGLLMIEMRIGKSDANDRLERMRPVPRIAWKTVGATYLALTLLLLWNQLRHHQTFPKVISAGLMAILFVWEALFFDYGSPGTGENAS